MSSLSANTSIGLDIDGSFEHILKSTNADKEYEFFWLTFKTSVIKFVTIKLKKNILSLSDELNTLQKENKYLEIKHSITTFMKSNLENVMECILKSLDATNICHLRTNIVRWQKIDENFVCCSINYDLLIVVKNLVLKNNDYVTLLENYREYLNTRDVNKIYMIVSDSIDSNLPSILNVFRNIIDVSKFIKDDCDKDICALEAMNSVKLIKYLQPLK